MTRRDDVVRGLAELHERLAAEGPEGAAKGHALLLEWLRGLLVMAGGDPTNAVLALVAAHAGVTRERAEIPLDVHKDCADYLREDPSYVCDPSCPARWAEAMGRLHEDEEDDA